MDKLRATAYGICMTQRPIVRFLDRKTPPHVLTLVLLAGLSALAMNVFLPSLPAMTAYFHTDYAVMQLSVSLYFLVNAVLQLAVGPISDRFGRRPVLLVSLALFALATLGTLLATTVETFLVCRMAQSAVAAAMVLSRAAVRDMVPEAEAASMIGYVTMGMAVVPMVGPMIGGALDQAFGWQASFVLLLAAGLAILALTWADLGETVTTRPASFRAQAAEYPALLAARRFWGYCLAAAFSAGSFYAYLGGAPFVGAEVFHLEPATLGFYFGTPALGYAAGNFVSGRYSMRFGINRMVVAGTTISTLGLGVLIVLDTLGADSAPVFFAFFAVMGVGNGLVMPNATSGMLSVRPQLAGTASGLGSAIMVAGGAGLSALAASVLGPGSGATPLLIVMTGSSVASVAAILYVIARERRLGLV